MGVNLSCNRIAPRSAPAPLAVTPGQIIAERYLVGDLLGEGGMGVVWAGTHLLLGTPVAIKLVHSELKEDAEVLERFVNEARAAAALKGERIARVFDAGQLPTGEPFLVMEQLDGVSLDHYLDEHGALPLPEARIIVLQVCEGLAEAHAAGLVHRDVKPANLFLARRADGQVSIKILDFGIAKQQAHHKRGLTDPNKNLGSPGYMSPEQMLSPASVDERADVWSVGVLLFELLTGELPFEGDTIAQIRTAVLTTPPTPPSGLRHGIPPELDAIVLRCLEKRPQGRFGSVSDLARALEQLAEPAAVDATDIEADERPSFASRDSLTPHGTRDVRTPPLARHRWPLVSALVALSSLIIGGYFQYRDPSLVRCAFNAARVALPGDPSLSVDALPAVVKTTCAAPVLLQPVHTALAVTETQRTPIAPSSAYAWVAPQPAHARNDTNPAESSTEATDRLVEDRYGF